MVIDWNPNVNKKLSLEGDHSLADGYVNTIEFSSGKKRTYLSNSFVPHEYPSLNIMLNNTIINSNGLTEYEEFKRWYEINLRYGVFPFYFPRLDFKFKVLIKIGEIGIYKFLNKPEYDNINGEILATFGLEELSYTKSVEHIILITKNNKSFMTKNKNLLGV